MCPFICLAKLSCSIVAPFLDFSILNSQYLLMVLCFRARAWLGSAWRPATPWAAPPGWPWWRCGPSLMTSTCTRPTPGPGWPGTGPGTARVSSTPCTTAAGSGAGAGPGPRPGERADHQTQAWALWPGMRWRGWRWPPTWPTTQTPTSPSYSGTSMR